MNTKHFYFSLENIDLFVYYFLFLYLTNFLFFVLFNSILKVFQIACNANQTAQMCLSAVFVKMDMRLIIKIIANLVHQTVRSAFSVDSIKVNL